jgi:GTP pyrophosphokinase
MADIAEKGFAAHWKYKEGGVESQFDVWISQVRELLESNDQNAIDLLDDFKLNLFTDEIYVFTPNGDMKNLPRGATALDFAFAVHTQIGINCLGVKINDKLVPLSHVLASGDQIEVITSKNQKPKEDWLNFVKTHRAKTKIKSSLNEEKRIVAKAGKIHLEKEFKKLKISLENISLKELQSYYNVPSELELYYKIAMGTIALKTLKGLEVRKGILQAKRTIIPKRVQNLFVPRKSASTKASKLAKPVLVIGDNMEKIDYKLASCCHPIPGNEVYGFITVTEGIKIHKTGCPNTIQLMSNYAYRIIKASWIDENDSAFLTGLKIIGIDDVGIVNGITQVISNELSVDMRSISFDSHDGIFEGRVMVLIHDTSHLTNLITKLKQLDGVREIKKIDG